MEKCKDVLITILAVIWMLLKWTFIVVVTVGWIVLGVIFSLVGVKMGRPRRW